MGYILLYQHVKTLLTEYYFIKQTSHLFYGIQFDYLTLYDNKVSIK